MDFLQSVDVTSITATGGQLNSSYALTNIVNDIPTKPYISNATTETITANIATGSMGFFIYGLLADSGEITLTLDDTEVSGNTLTLDTTPYSTNEQIKIGTSLRTPPFFQRVSIGGFSGTVLPASISTNTTVTGSSGAPDTIELGADLTIGDGGTAEVSVTVGLEAGGQIQFNGSGQTLTSGSMQLQLTTSTDVKDLAVSGDNIGYWKQDSGATGRFAKDSTEAGNSNFINVNNHGNIMIGSHITVGGTAYQVTKIVGDGTASGSITLSGTFSSGAITQILNPIKVGVFQIGTVIRTNNPRVGLQKGFKDFSFKNKLENGGYAQTQRNVATIYSINAVLERTEAENLIDHFRAYRSKPFPVLILNDMPTAQNEEKTYSGLFYFQESPNINYRSTRALYQQVNFRLCEVL